jgi:ABC-2 type transport system ATP-binding protein
VAGTPVREDSAVATTAVAVTGLEHSYGDHPALRGITFEVQRGEIFGLLGPNGGGKTTLFRILSTLLRSQRGTVRVLGADLVREQTAVRRRLGVVFQSPALDRKLTVRENLRHQGHLYGLRGADLERRIDTALERFKLADRRDSMVEGLSGGLRRRVEIAKGLLHAPELLLLDEPSTGLDPGARRDLWQLLQEIRTSDGVTVLLTSHILEEVERADRVAILERGRLVGIGTPAELKASVGGDVLTIASAAPERLAAAIAVQLHVQPVVLDGMLRIEGGAGPDLVRQILTSFGTDVESVTLAKPTLEDVFIRVTGHRFWGGGGEPS